MRAFDLLSDVKIIATIACMAGASMISTSAVRALSLYIALSCQLVLSMDPCNEKGIAGTFLA